MTKKLMRVWSVIDIEFDADVERTDESTRRLAVCNMEWDRISAVELTVIFGSVLPPGDSILGVRKYRSENGKERMKKYMAPLNWLALAKRNK